MVNTLVSSELCELFVCLMCFQMYFVCKNHFPQFIPFLLGPFKSVNEGIYWYKREHSAQNNFKKLLKSLVHLNAILKRMEQNSNSNRCKAWGFVNKPLHLSDIQNVETSNLMFKLELQWLYWRSAIRK
jgi:hypothetical protein